ncbi:MAG: hypothetical protein HY273_08105 [Gammaproteobacteria bacterium]|nr:hypothetical protein [Gammaproteobacteria bacterium]
MGNRSKFFSHASAPPPDFLRLSSVWCKDQSENMLGLIWRGYDQMQSDKPIVDGRDLERSITQLLEPRIARAMSGDEPFYVQHGPFERATMQPPPAQPPQNDIAFKLWADERIMWPMEAKVLETSGAVSEYIKDIHEQFLACRYAPFSGEGAMLGYLLSGTADDAFQNISKKTPCGLEDHPAFSSRPQKLSSHTRNVPSGKTYPSRFCCHHLMLEFPYLKRVSG